MEHRRVLIKRMLRMALPMVVLVGIIIGCSQVKITSIKPGYDSVHVKAQVTEILEDYSAGEAFTGNQKVTATITSGEYKGQSCELNNANAYQRGAYCVVGTRVIALVQRNSEGKLTGSVYNYDRTSMVFVLLGLFAFSLILVGGKKGAASFYALALTFACIVCMYIPLLYVGMNGVMAAILTAVVILVVSIYIIPQHKAANKLENLKNKKNHPFRRCTCYNALIIRYLRTIFHRELNSPASIHTKG